MEKLTVTEFPESVEQLEIIGGGGPCLCGLPGCLGHPVVVADGREFIEFTVEQYQFLLGDLQQRMTQ